MLYDPWECEECGMPWHRAELKEGSCPGCGGHCVQDDDFGPDRGNYDANDGTEGGG